MKKYTFVLTEKQALHTASSLHDAYDNWTDQNCPEEQGNALKVLKAFEKQMAAQGLVRVACSLTEDELRKVQTNTPTAGKE